MKYAFFIIDFRYNLLAPYWWLGRSNNIINHHLKIVKPPPVFKVLNLPNTV